MAQKPVLHFWRRHSALRVCRLRPVQAIGEYARKRTRACGRRRLRTELVRTAVRSRQGFAAARAQARLRGCRRKAAGVAGAAGDGSGCLGRGRLPADFSGWRSAGALAADPDFREEGLPVFPVSACRAALGGSTLPIPRGGKSAGWGGAGNGAKKSVCAMASESRRAVPYRAVLCRLGRDSGGCARRPPPKSGFRPEKEHFSEKRQIFVCFFLTNSI